jgi:hypothetical protein
MKTVVKFGLLAAAMMVLAMPAFAQRHGGQMSWSGDVDDTVIVTVHGDNVTDRAVSGKDTKNVNVDLNGRLPHEPVEVEITNWSGRGSVEVVRQPDPENDYTAKIRITDPQSGRGHYTFTLDWRRIDFGGPIRRN